MKILVCDPMESSAIERMRSAGHCGFTKCGRSHNGAMWAVKLGYKNVYRYPGGIKGWIEADYEVEKVK